jgi:hypothetical protein
LGKITNSLLNRQRKISDIWLKKYGYGHLALFSEEEIKTLLTQAKFKILEISYRCLWIPKLRFILYPYKCTLGAYIFFKAKK